MSRLSSNIRIRHRIVRRRVRRSWQIEAAPLASAQVAGLRYVNDAESGIRRQRAGRGFRYIGPDGTWIRRREVISRIRSLVIPPAWNEVWICPLPNGHIQATGRDARGRKQYRYHPRWQTARNETKYHRMIAFAKALPTIRAHTEQDLALPGLPRPKVLALVVRLLEATRIRIGNEEYRRENGSVGLTTMRDGHVTVRGSRIHFSFRGKSGIRHHVGLHDRRLAALVQRCQDLPGQSLFQYLDDDREPGSIDSGDVNDYLREIAGEEFTAKDFRTWAGTLIAARALRELGPAATVTEAKRNIRLAVEEVSRELGNTKAVCRKCYIHPAVMETHLDGSFYRSLRRRRRKAGDTAASLGPEEAALLAFLQSQLSHGANGQT